MDPYAQLGEQKQYEQYARFVIGVLGCLQQLPYLAPQTKKAGWSTFVVPPIDLRKEHEKRGGR
jgi:hypothetical protein